MGLEERGEGGVIKAGRSVGAGHAGEADGCVWLSDGRGEVQEQRVGGGIVEKVVMLASFEGTANVTSQGAKGDGADEAVGGRTTFGERMGVGYEGGQKGFVEGEERH